MPQFYYKFIDFNNDESGVGTAWALSWLILCFAIAGLSVDVTNAWKVRQFLQSTADMAAHAGAIELGTVGNNTIEDVVTSAANSFAEINMNSSRYGDVLVDADIQVGYWDRDTRKFVQMVAGDVETPTAVRVITRQDGGASNKVGTFFLRFAGFDDFSITTRSTVERFVSQCERDGITTAGKIKLSTQQLFKGEYCAHGQLGIDMSGSAQSGNVFEPGTVASMADLDNCGQATGGSLCTDDHNPGIEAAARQYSRLPTKVDDIPYYIQELQDPKSDIQPDYINAAVLVERFTAADFDATKLQPGKVHLIDCRGRSNIDMGVPSTTKAGPKTVDPDADTLLKSQMVIVGIDCDFVFDKTIAYEDVIFATTSTGRQSISGSAGVVLGRDDGCVQGGEAVFITQGDVSFAAQLSAYDVEFIVAGDIGLASRTSNTGASVHVGTNIYAGGDVNITTQHVFEGCAGATLPSFDLKYSYRFVQ